MNKKILKKLGQLTELKRLAHNAWVDSKYADNEKNKLELITKVAKQLEEQKRGFLKSKINYEGMADFIINNQTVGYEELLKGITNIALQK